MSLDSCHLRVRKGNRDVETSPVISDASLCLQLHEICSGETPCTLESRPRVGGETNSLNLEQENVGQLDIRKAVFQLPQRAPGNKRSRLTGPKRQYLHRVVELFKQPPFGFPKWMSSLAFAFCNACSQGPGESGNTQWNPPEGA